MVCSPPVHSDSLFFCSVYSADSYKSVQSIVAGESVPPLRNVETHLDSAETPVATQSQKEKFDPFTHRFFFSPTPHFSCPAHVRLDKKKNNSSRVDGHHLQLVVTGDSKSTQVAGVKVFDKKQQFGGVIELAP